MSLFPIERQSIDLPGAAISYFPNFLPDIEGNAYYDSLLKDTPWRHDDIKVFGTIYKQPRLTALYASNTLPYTYSNITMQPLQFTPTLEKLKAKVEEKVGLQFTTALLNLYRDGRDSNGWHSDDEKELGRNPVIASISLGNDRVFKFRDKKATSNTYKLVLQHGSLLIMRGETQHNWQHQVPKTAKTVGPRINCTFRVLR